VAEASARPEAAGGAAVRRTPWDEVGAWQIGGGA
jgi:hypothetical protein